MRQLKIAKMFRIKILTNEKGTYGKEKANFGKIQFKRLY